MPRIDLASYRTLRIYQALLTGPQSLQELNNLCSADPCINQNYSEAQLMRDINGLRQWGCTIPKASRRYQGKYVLLNHPLTLPMSTAHQVALLAIAHREAMVAHLLRQSVALLPTELQGKLVAIPIEVVQDYPLSPPPDPQLLQKLAPKLERKGVIRFTYTRNEPRTHLAQPIRIQQEDGRYYLLAFMPEWTPPQQTRFLLEYITALETEVHDAAPQAWMQGGEGSDKHILYRLWPPLAARYRPRPQETLSPDPVYPEAVQITVQVKDLFALKQRLLKYGACCEVLQPALFRETMQREVLQMVERYTEPQKAE